MPKPRKRREIGRYTNLPGVLIDESRVPASLRPLLPIARDWGNLGDEALERAIGEASRETIAQAVEAALPMKDEIHDFAYRSAGAAATPVPDEVVLFQMFAWSLNRLEVEMH